MGISIDLSKAFDAADHIILELYGVADQNQSWLKNYLSNRKQFIQINNDENTELQIIICGVPQGSILGQLLFLLYVNDLTTFIYLFIYLFICAFIYLFIYSFTNTYTGYEYH